MKICGKVPCIPTTRKDAKSNPAVTVHSSCGMVTELAEKTLTSEKNAKLHG